MKEECDLHLSILVVSGNVDITVYVYTMWEGYTFHNSRIRLKILWVTYSILNVPS